MTSPSHSRPVPAASRPPESPMRALSPDQASARSASNARLASPIPSSSAHGRTGSFAQSQRGNESGGDSGRHTPLAGGSSGTFGSGQPGASALASALHASLGRSPPRHGTFGGETGSLHHSSSFAERPIASATYGSMGRASMHGRRGSGMDSPAPYEDFEVVRKHLAGPKPASPAAVDVVSSRNRSPLRPAHQATPTPEPADGTEPGDEEGNFSSLRMQGGDIHRAIYRRTEAEEDSVRGRHQRSKSFHLQRPGPEDPELDIEGIRQPGGFRRNHLIRNTPNQPSADQVDGSGGANTPVAGQPNFLTRSFYEFLSLYGHFAGEEAAEYEESESDPSAMYGTDDQSDGGERRPLLSRQPSRRERKRDSGPKKGAAGTAFILLKSFVGTGVLFLPKAFLNGGMLFCVTVLLGIACVSYYCFLLLTKSRLALKGSYADMGEMMYGRPLRSLINTSLVISQIGFASAYIVFVAENLQAFTLAVTNNKTLIDIKLMIILQLVIFLPLSLYRNLNNISYVVYIADIFIVLGLVYLYYYSVATLVDQHGIADIVLFNPETWTIFIGTAIFTFEGIGLIIPIQDGMKRPEQLPRVLGICMVVMSTIFISMGVLAYAAFGSKTRTVIILNMPQDNRFVNAVQFIYSIAILLSTPMQLYPAITIMENGIFTRSGKYSRNIKWRKNLFRFAVVMASAFISWIGANDLDKFVALVGSFACVPLVYIYPPLIHQKAVATSMVSRVVDFVLMVFGFVMMAYTSALTFIRWIE